MTGVVFTAAHPGGDHPYSTEVAPGLGAPVHQHLFSARLDMSVDGQANAVEEVDVGGLPIGPDNPYGNAIAQRVTRLTSEAVAARSGDAARGRVWRVLSTSAVNRFGKPTAFTLCPEPTQLTGKVEELARQAQQRGPERRAVEALGHRVHDRAADRGREHRPPQPGLGAVLAKQHPVKPVHQLPEWLVPREEPVRTGSLVRMLSWCRRSMARSTILDSRRG